MQVKHIMWFCIISDIMVGESFSTKAQTHSLCESILSMQTLDLGAIKIHVENISLYFGRGTIHDDEIVWGVCHNSV